MSTREGNLEAPTRHAIDWQSADFYDEAKCLQELERIFDICHGCRRCVSLCNTFPTLFDLVDATDDGEVHGVKKEAYWSVVDQCYLCDLCYMTKCPYVPPHSWNVDFPHTMLRAKAIKFKQGHVKGGEKFLASTDNHVLRALLDAVGADSDPETFLAGITTPVFFGSALTNFGVRLLLDGVVALAPEPSPRVDENDGSDVARP